MPRHSVVVRGRASEWAVYVEQEQAEAMREDGFEVQEIVNTIPAWAVDLGLTRIWGAVQDLWDWPSRWGRK
jgi:hypothetical protein